MDYYALDLPPSIEKLLASLHEFQFGHTIEKLLASLHEFQFGHTDIVDHTVLLHFIRPPTIFSTSPSIEVKWSQGKQIVLRKNCLHIYQEIYLRMNQDS